MKYRFMFIMILGVILLVLAGCGGAASTPSGTPGSQSSPPGSQATATTTTTPSQAQVVHVTISDSGISADRSTFYAGMPYHFVVTNTGQAAYQFMMGQGGWGWQNGRMPMGWQRQMTPYWFYQIAPGATQTFDYTFPAAAVGQPVRFGCSQMGRQGGMWYPSVVQPQATPASSGTQITIQNFAYQPATLQVRVGTTVTWTNQDNVPHSVTFKNGMKESGLLSRGQSFSYTFSTPGTYQYYCTVHPYMVATVTVVS